MRDGYRVTVVENADTAIEVLRKEPTRFSAVRSDLMLQGTSARNLIDHMVTHHPDLPIIAMSGYADGSPGSRQDLPSAISFIQKPFTPDELRTIMRQATHHRRGLTSPPTDPDSAPGS
ncbi:MAG: response regulator [Gemmatimonadota bacterium]|nr:response regulator [Gemmatimonadota bacterium]